MTSRLPDRGTRRGGLRRALTRITVLITSIAAFAASWVVVARADQTQFGANGAAPETLSAAAQPATPVPASTAPFPGAPVPAAPLDERQASAGTRITQAAQAAPTGAAGSAVPSPTAAAVRTPVAPALAPAPAAPTRSVVIRRSRAS